ncbi:hypothetical protein FISHEDRAFT_67136 [Fistulina hepatica ATCC 64428]|uniref:Uncharacterized protein n=1 Tax=Fistulina hepatica ATCC 64428 TaxID=1128425 RepID=A0A0D7A5L0_9AGAR|nr:hypothetical protein FISHEDRAFT_67136 [Fistulina hepatica ATCC 64428]
MPSLAGRPPFATDLPDSYYAQPVQRQAQPSPRAPSDQKRSSAYDHYDQYVVNDPQARRDSAAGALGLGLLNGSLDDDDDDYSTLEDYSRKPMDPDQPGPSVPSTPSSKHAALAAATTSGGRQSPSPPPQYVARQQPAVAPIMQPAPQRRIAQPQPGYVAPMDQLNLARPQPAAVPAGRQQQGYGPAPNMRSNNPFAAPVVHTEPPPTMPHPLQPPMSPITPVFARPRVSEVKFKDEKKHNIIRGDGEDVLIPRRGQKGDDFWRRFSMVVHEEQSKRPGEKDSSWLKKTQSGSSRLAKWVLFLGIILVLAVAGAIGLWYYVAHTDSAQTQPSTLGGSADEKYHTTTDTATATNTVDRREPLVFATAVPIKGDMHYNRSIRRAKRVINAFAHFT